MGKWSKERAVEEVRRSVEAVATKAVVGAAGKVEERCSGCKYYRGGWCRRYPSGVTRGPNDWCGEYKAREKEA